MTQLHLALVMAIDAKLLVLDEPTLGLDILYRKQFYDSLLNDYFDRSRTIVVTTHQVEEIQHILTDLMFINRGRIVLDCSMEEFESRYLEVMVNPEHVAAARALKPIHERQVFGRSILLFDRVDRQPARRTWRRAHAQHRRLVRRRDGQSARRGARSGCMNTQSNAMPNSPLDPQRIAPATALPATQTRPMYWSIRRELWENRSIYIAPLVVAGVVLIGFLIATIGRALAMVDPAQKVAVLAERNDFAAAADRRDCLHRRRSSTVSTRCTANAAIAASCSGSRCRFPISRPCSRRRAFRSWFCRCSPSRSSFARS